MLSDRLHAGAGQPLSGSPPTRCRSDGGLVPTPMLLAHAGSVALPARCRSACGGRSIRSACAPTGRNPRLAGQPLHTAQDIEAALALLRSAAEAETQRSATSVLVSTALLQNGRLDGLVVLDEPNPAGLAHCAHLWLVPLLRQLSYLYGNVGACVLVWPMGSPRSGDFAALTAPIVQAAAPSTMGSCRGGRHGRAAHQQSGQWRSRCFSTLRVGWAATPIAHHSSSPTHHHPHQRHAPRCAAAGPHRQRQRHPSQPGRLPTPQAQRDQHRTGSRESAQKACRSVGGATQFPPYQATAHSLNQAVQQVKALPALPPSVCSRHASRKTHQVNRCFRPSRLIQQALKAMGFFWTAALERCTMMRPSMRSHEPTAAPLDCWLHRL